jgi:IclR family pca regulon transcriptional regulator
MRGVTVLEGTSILYIDRARSFRREQRKIDLGLAPGSRLLAHCTAMGKLQFAHLPESKRLPPLAEMQLSRHGPNTIISKQALREQLDKIHEEGIAVNDQELARELYAIAVSASNREGTVVAVISLAAHSSRISLPRVVDAPGPLLLAGAGQISARIASSRGLGGAASQSKPV